MKLTKKLAVLALLLFVGVGAAGAEIVLDFNGDSANLAALLDDGSIRVGDKVFYDWTYETVDGPAPEAITITGGYINGEIGLCFQGAWQTPPGQISSVIAFSVEADDPFLVNDAILYMPGAAAGSGGSVDIWESVIPELAGFDGQSIQRAPVGLQLHTYANDQGEVIYDADAFEPTEGYKEVRVSKEIVLNGPASLSVFYQGFSQIPEPASLTVVLAGSLALIRRRK